MHAGHIRNLFEQDRRRTRLRDLLAWRRSGSAASARSPPPLLHQGPPRKSPAPRGRRHGHGGRHPGARELVAEGAVGPRDRLPSGARAPAGFHRRPRAGRPGGDARRGEADGRGPEADQPADAGGPRDRPFRAGGPVRRGDRLPRQRGEGVRTQRGALRVPAMGEGVVPQLPRRPARHRDLSPGEPRAPRPRRLHAERPLRRAGVPGHPRGDRLPHADDQRAGRGRVGRGRDRGGGGDARPADLDAHPRGGGIQDDRGAPRRGDRDRPRPHGHPDAAEERRGGEVRRVLRKGALLPLRGRPGDDLEHVAGVRRDDRLLPRRPGDALLPSLHRPGQGAGEARGGVLQGAGALPHGRHPRPGLLRHPFARPFHRGAVHGGAAPAAGPRAAQGREGRVPQGPFHVGEGGADGKRGRRRGPVDGGGRPRRRRISASGNREPGRPGRRRCGSTRGCTTCTTARW